MDTFHRYCSAQFYDKTALPITDADFPGWLRAAPTYTWTLLHQAARWVVLRLSPAKAPACDAVFHEHLRYASDIVAVYIAAFVQASLYAPLEDWPTPVAPMTLLPKRRLLEIYSASRSAVCTEICVSGRFCGWKVTLRKIWGLMSFVRVA
jgi:hypothetical protein